MADKLETYRRKRDFDATPEPGGEGDDGGGAGRYVIQEHHARRLHWDLRLEHDEALASWAIPNGIPMEPKENRMAVRTEDHPLEYLDFHGEIPKGNYGAGTMTIWDRGTYDLHEWNDKKVTVDFHGERLNGRYALFRISDGDEWMIHRMDPAEPGREPMPEHVVPMNAKLAKLPSDDDRYGFEVKWDGVRAIAYMRPGRIHLESRNLNDITAQYPELRGLTGALGAHEAVLDGEIVAFDADDKPSFERLQQRMHQTSETLIRRRMKSHPVSYMVFDLLYLDGRSLMEEPYSERRERLAELGLDGDHWQTPAYSAGNGDKLLAATREQGLEGLVAKRLDSRYEPGKRGGAWLKVKNTARQELVIGGWVPGEGRRRNRIGALLVCFYEGGELRYAGKVGTGFTDKTLKELADALAPLERDTSPFRPLPKPPKGAIFVEPKLVAEIEFTEWTPDGMLRHPSFKGLRDDKPADQVVAERVPEDVPAEPVDESELPDLDVADYYTRVAPALLPHLHGRPLVVDGEPGGVVGDVPALVRAAGRAGVELHASLAPAGDEKHPAFMVLALGGADSRQVGVWIRGMLRELGLESFAKVAAAGGLHVYVPVGSGATYDDTRAFAHAVAQTIAKQFPDREPVDWSVNDPSTPPVCPYSLLEGDELTVSAPVSWEEVEGDDGSLVFDPETALRRVDEEGDLFAPVLALRQDLPKI